MKKSKLYINELMAIAALYQRLGLNDSAIEYHTTAKLANSHGSSITHSAQRSNEPVHISDDWSV
jgi:hypothetical protein